MKKILFLSGLDFKKKSIQVIYKTPEAYVRRGWHVDYIVARDDAPNGNYAYEEVVNIPGVEVERFFWPFANKRAKLKRPFNIILSKISSYLVVIKLILRARRKLQKNDYDIVYGYELQGVLAMHALRIIGALKGVKTISRFQGSFLNEMIEGRQISRLMFNIDAIMAIRFRSDLIIMTNDGTKGDKAVERIKRTKRGEVAFLVNGVDNFILNHDATLRLKGELRFPQSPVFLSVSRLVGWKKVDRNIRLLRTLLDAGVDRFNYIVVGEGAERSNLEKLVVESGLSMHVKFVGAVKHSDVGVYYAAADYFLSMYDSSNVGNPLLEAIKSNLIIVTLNNGDTGSWIEHNKNGLIYDSVEISMRDFASDVLRLMQDQGWNFTIRQEVMKTAKSKLWSWEERLDREVALVGALL